jgi:hypothetical protein
MKIHEYQAKATSVTVPSVTAFLGPVVWLVKVTLLERLRRGETSSAGFGTAGLVTGG